MLQFQQLDLECARIYMYVKLKKKFKIHKIRKFEIQNDFSTDFSKVTRTNTVLHVLKRSKISSFEGGDIYQNEH